ncbi:CBL-interacting serine/threonine-protein kinase 20 [Golovinomyces cichoracearum]|uniref:non-specific serine/threonine protein kinase n=1 Tax=Golovinomyces cichoracearum TaxID=62708 RepID=A0A420I8G6_9PEZI|nr:CBL-interacting serine/threonine-protein kinase 20 [Golovinomyces cichoracearum]
MSLVPYSSRDSREIVLRHNDAIVLRDPLTQQLILRGAKPSTHCPTCHQPIRGSSPEHPESTHRSPAFISSNYFRLLRTLRERTDEESPIPTSPVRRLVEPAFDPNISARSSGSVSDSYDDGINCQEIRYSIKKEAFSQSYFKKFFIVEKELGRGGKGVVLLVRHELDGVSLGQFACKRVPVGDDHAWLEKVLVEVQLLQELSHINLVSYRHVWLEDVKLNRFGPSVPCAFILQQYCNAGDLLHFVTGTIPELKSAKEKMKEQHRRRSRGQAQFEIPNSESYMRRLEFEDIYSFFGDIVSGIAHLHASNYIHRDLKPSNCLLHQEGNDIRCLISDFGEVQVENMVRRSTGTTGTISYCAPEVLKKDSSGRYGNFTTKSDIFSLGMILYFMCFSELPYKSADSVDEENEDITLLRAEISSWTGFCDERRERPDLPNQLYDLLKRLLAINPDDRPSTTEILTAIRTEKGFRNIPRSRHPNSASLRGHLLKALKNQKPLAECLNDSTDPADFAAYVEDEIISDSGNTEPEEISSLIVKSSSTARSRSPSRIRKPPTPPYSKIKTPLLMPPPSKSFFKPQNNTAFYTYHSYRWFCRNRKVPDIGVKSLLYTIKIWSITSPCKPGTARASLWWPLTVLTAIELAIGSKGGWRLATWIAIFHFTILGAIAWYYGGITQGICDGTSSISI